jgi:uncharacterized protein YaiE (UPF0345 family)
MMLLLHCLRFFIAHFIETHSMGINSYCNLLRIDLMSQIENVRLQTTGNVYFEGKCVSFTFFTAEGTRKSIGVILPATLTFGTAAPEVMELQQGHCRVRLAGSEQWQDYTGGQSFAVGANTSFDIEVLEPTHYICHYG